MLSFFNKKTKYNFLTFSVFFSPVYHLKAGTKFVQYCSISISTTARGGLLADIIYKHILSGEQCYAMYFIVRNALCTLSKGAKGWILAHSILCATRTLQKVPDRLILISTPAVVFLTFNSKNYPRYSGLKFGAILEPKHLQPGKAS